MKKTLITFSVLIAVISCSLAYAATGQRPVALSSSSIAQFTSKKVTEPNVGVSIGTVDAIYTNYNSFAGDYECQLSETIIMYFCKDYDYGETARLTAIYTSETAVTIPDSVHFISSNGGNAGTYPVVIISDYYDKIGYNRLYNPFPSHLTTLTLPSTVQYYRSYDPYNPVDKNIDTVYLLGDACHYATADTVCVKNAYVCNKSYLSNILSNTLYSNAEILPYGWEYTSAIVNVDNNGEFAESYLTQNDYDWGAIQNLKVTGNIKITDLDAIKKLTTLIKLDLSETSISGIPDNYMSGRPSLIDVQLPSVVKIGKSSFKNCKRLRSISSISTMEIGAEAFSGCSSLKNINVKDVELINENAFKDCSSLESIDLSKSKYIGYSAFSGCSSLKSAHLDSVIVVGYMSFDSGTDQNIGETFRDCISLSSVSFGNGLRKICPASFQNTAIESVVILDGLEIISERVFAGCAKLENVILPNTIKTIASGAFDNCTLLADIELPSRLTEIGEYAFYGCSSLKKIAIPATTTTIGGLAFYDSALCEMVCFASVPPTIPPTRWYDHYGYAQYSQYPFVGGEYMDMNRAVLYIPPFSKTGYRNDSNWNAFNIMKSIESDIDYLLINQPLHINLEDGDAIGSNNPTIDIRYDGPYQDEDTQAYYCIGQLTTIGEGTLSAGELAISGQLSSRLHNSYQYMPTLINYADKMRADNVTHNLTFYNYNGSGEWHFISLPYDVKVSDIIPGDNTYWVIRKYDSAARAAGNTSSTWVNLTNDDILEAGKGYIVSVTGGNRSLTFTSGNTLTKNNLFRSTDVIVPLTEYASEFAHNRSWNLIGNPYPCYFDMHYLNEEFSAPITVWNGSSYVAYSPVDDNLVLSPYEAFFVQCPLDATEMSFKEAGRMHAKEAKSFSRAPSYTREAVSAEDRNVFNFLLTGDDYEDRARIVLNPKAKLEYEIGRDASKFFANNSEYAQIYVGDDVNYSISERPINDGTAMLGLRATKEEVCTISLSGIYSSDWSVIVIDNVTGASVDLTKNNYSFTTTCGDSSNRFTVKFQLGNHSGLESIIADFGDNAHVTVATVSGVIVYSGRLSEIKVPSPGLYIIANGQDSRKAILK